MQGLDQWVHGLMPLDYAAQTLLLKLTDQDAVVITTPQGLLVAQHPLATSYGVQIGQPAYCKPLAPQARANEPRARPAAPLVEVRSLQDYDQLLEEQ